MAVRVHRLFGLEFKQTRSEINNLWGVLLFDMKMLCKFQVTKSLILHACRDIKYILKYKKFPHSLTNNCLMIVVKNKRYVKRLQHWEDGVDFLPLISDHLGRNNAQIEIKIVSLLLFYKF